jgi:hypothetical protein
MEIHDKDDIREILDLVDTAIEKCSFAPMPVFLIWQGEIRFEWRRDDLVYGASVSWVHDNTYAINVGAPNEGWFGSPELTKKLASLARRESIRTWLWSNPELEDVEEMPDWYTQERSSEMGDDTTE